jgi:hypothetical protein
MRSSERRPTKGTTSALVSGGQQPPSDIPDVKVEQFRMGPRMRGAAPMPGS